ncbi:MAG: hypothetical protein NW223_23870, partial [Hyphomicrobiaceae bacterium]|nr:hypothetical protein [Hyphomicrobiaceae bacterium]
MRANKINVLLGTLVTALTALPVLVAAAQHPTPPAPADVDPVRQRAEALAQEASERFTEVLRAGRVAQGPPARQGEDPWTPAARWLQHAQEAYDKLVTGLRQGPDGLPPPPPAAAPKAAPAVTAQTAPPPAKSPAAVAEPAPKAAPPAAA